MRNTNATTSASMAPSDEKVINEIKDVAARLYASDREGLTVNIVRNVVELELGLQQGSLKGGEWKERSKGVVLGMVVSCDVLLFLVWLGAGSMDGRGWWCVFV